MAKTNVNGLDPHQQEFVKLIRENADRHPVHEVFRDFCEMGAIALSNKVDMLNRGKRENRYLEIIKRYRPGEVHRFPEMFGAMVASLERGFHDCLGELFMALELGDHWKGQYFTPFSIASLMARMTMGDVRGLISRKGFFTINEPCSGAGAMFIAAAQAVHEQGINYQQHMHATAQDIDLTAVHMSYVQLALYHIPAIVIHGNTLAVTEWDHWVTPAHVLGRWDRRLQLDAAVNGFLALDGQAEQARTSQEKGPTQPAAEAELFPIEHMRAEVVGQRIEQLGLFA